MLSGPLPWWPPLCWETPPGLEMILAQDGVPSIKVNEPHPWSFRAGRFVFFDGRQTSTAKVRSLLTSEHRAIDIDVLRREWPFDPFEALIDDRASYASWRVGDRDLVERVARRPKASIRRRLLTRLREEVSRAGGHWVRIAPYPRPYRAAFGFRADLDEPYPDDFAHFARARRPLDDCSTHFVSTAAYGRDRRVLDSLRGLDVQSHGHFHVVYRDPEANRRNLKRAHSILSARGFEPDGFAAPEGRWNHGLDDVLEELGYRYSSDFHLGYDDVPFFPWRGDRFSKVLQVPVHPICEGLFLEAGENDPRVIADYFKSILRAKIDAGDSAFLYGHPERRLGRMPEILRAIAAEIAGEDRLWRVTLGEFARWRRWRADRRWSIVVKESGRLEAQFDEWDATFPMSLEIIRGRHGAALPVLGPRMPLQFDDLAYVLRPEPAEFPAPKPVRPRRVLRAAVRAAIDWETVTPLDELPVDSLTAKIKHGLRKMRASREERTARS